MITNHGVPINMNKTRKCHSAYARFREEFSNVYNANNLKSKFLTRNKNGAGCQTFVGGRRNGRKGTRKGRKDRKSRKGRKGTRRNE